MAMASEDLKRKAARLMAFHAIRGLPMDQCNQRTLPTATST